jgi:hypothetical protein
MTNLGKVAAAAVPGCQHVLAGGLPCQDAVATFAAADRVILAVSDGHGDAAYEYSDEGARIAVSVAVGVFDKLIDHVGSSARSTVGASLDTELAGPLRRRIAFEWNRRVKHHARMIAARDDKPVPWPDGVTGDWVEEVKSYGCTLVAAAFTKDLGIWLRLGDGEALAVGQASVKRIFAPADKSMGQATHSLSMRSAVEHMQVVFDTPGKWEVALLVSDGVADQYDEDPSLEEQWGMRIIESIRAKGWTGMALDIPRDLGTVARDGDDCAVAVAWFPPAATEG